MDPILYGQENGGEPADLAPLESLDVAEPEREAA